MLVLLSQVLKPPQLFPQRHAYSLPNPILIMKSIMSAILRDLGLFKFWSFFLFPNGAAVLQQWHCYNKLSCGGSDIGRLSSAFEITRTTHHSEQFGMRFSM